MHGGPQILGCSGCNQDEAWASWPSTDGSAFQWRLFFMIGTSSRMD